MLTNRYSFLMNLKYSSVTGKKIKNILMTILENDLEDEDSDLEDFDFQDTGVETKTSPLVFYEDPKFEDLCKILRFDITYLSLDRKDFLISSLMLSKICHYIRS